MDDFKQHPPNSNQIDTEHHRPDFLHPETEPSPQGMMEIQYITVSVN